MTSNASVQFHLRFVKEKHAELIRSLDDLTGALVSEQLDKKIASASLCLEKSNDLKSSIATEDVPEWLPSLIKGLGFFRNKQWQSTNLINHLIKNVEVIRNHQWIFDKPSDAAFDFDAIFERYKSQSRLAELFEDIVRILGDIQASGEVDSVTMMSSLGKVISTLKKNKDGSYFSINSAWSFLMSFLKNYMWGELSKIPVLGTALEALEKTIQETNEEMYRVHSEVRAEMEKVVETEVKALNRKADFSFVGYDKDGFQSSSIGHKRIFDEQV